jgi:predicted secreted Zn-dependent protease
MPGCEVLFIIGSVTIRLNVEFRLPRWTDYAKGPAALKKKWGAYMQALRQHENGHKDIGVKTAVEIERSIAELEPAQTCDDLAETANALGRRIISEYAAAEREYDAQTDFGEAQGAVFP